MLGQRVSAHVIFQDIAKRFCHQSGYTTFLLFCFVFFALLLAIRRPVSSQLHRIKLRLLSI